MGILVLKFQEETPGAQLLQIPAQIPSSHLAAQRPQVTTWELQCLPCEGTWVAQSWIRLRSLCVLIQARCCCWERQGLSQGPLKWLSNSRQSRDNVLPARFPSFHYSSEHRPVHKHFLMETSRGELVTLAPLVLSLTSDCLDLPSTAFLTPEKPSNQKETVTYVHFHVLL